MSDFEVKRTETGTSPAPNESLSSHELFLNRREMLASGARAFFVAAALTELSSESFGAETKAQAKKEGTKLSEGAVFPEISLKDPNGRELKLSEVNKDTMVLVDFWGPWCGNCLREIPALRQTYSALKDRQFFDPATGGKIANGFTIFSVSANFDEQQEASWKNMIKTRGLNWKNHVQSDDLEFLRTEYGISGYPTNFLLGADGKIIKKNVDVGSLPLMLKENLKNPK